MRVWRGKIGGKGRHLNYRPTNHSAGPIIISRRRKIYIEKKTRGRQEFLLISKTLLKMYHIVHLYDHRNCHTGWQHRPYLSRSWPARIGILTRSIEKTKFLIFYVIDYNITYIDRILDTFGTLDTYVRMPRERAWLVIVQRFRPGAWHDTTWHGEWHGRRCGKTLWDDGGIVSKNGNREQDTIQKYKRQNKMTTITYV